MTTDAIKNILLMRHVCLISLNIQLSSYFPSVLMQNKYFFTRSTLNTNAIRRNPLAI